jgi:hypothetical protein
MSLETVGDADEEVLFYSGSLPQKMAKRVIGVVLTFLDKAECEAEYSVHRRKSVHDVAF